MDRALLRAARCILNNCDAELNQQTHNMTGISNFACVIQFRNVCRMFKIIYDNALDYYIGTNVASDCAVHATRNA